jgi:hypothetical protein
LEDGKHQYAGLRAPCTVNVKSVVNDDVNGRREGTNGGNVRVAIA